MKICVITTVHPPDDIRISKELNTLKNAGNEIFYIAPEGNFNLDNINYIPIRTYKSRILRFVLGKKEAFEQAKNTNADIYHFHDPELISIGLRLKKLGKKVIYDIHEDYPSVILKKTWIPKILRKPISVWFKRKEEKSVKKFDGIIVVVEEQLERFNNPTYTIIPNYPDLSIFEEYKNNDNKRNVRFVYIGSIDEDRAIYETIEAFRILIQRAYNIEYYIIGPIYTERLKKIINEVSEKMPSLKYLNRIPQKKALEIASSCDVGMMVLHHGKSKEESSPLKMFEYMALGLPIVASDFPKWKSILDNKPCALYVNPESPKDIADKMKMLIENQELREKLGKAAKENSKKYSWNSVAKRLLDFYNRVFND